jgi:nucleotide-binding universal stress UspA family protein
MDGVATVLLTTDGSDFATEAMQRGVALLGSDHRFVALNVVTPPMVPASPLTPMDTLHTSLPDPELEAMVEHEERSAAADDLAVLIASLGVEATRRTAVGDPGTVICELAAELPADAIVIGSHGHGLLKRMFLGSVSTHVLHHAPCPVLVVRRP